MTNDEYMNSLLGTGMLYAALTGGTVPGTTVSIITDDDGQGTNQLLVKFDIGGPPAERGYIVTVTIPHD